MTVLKPTTVPSKRLAASINAASTTIQLNNILGWNGSALTSADFGDTLYAVLRNDNNTVMELMELDPTTIASSSITITRRGLKFTGDVTTEVTANKLAWVKNETIVELGSDSPQLFQWLKEYIDAASIAGAVDASTSAKGVTKMSVAPASSSNPIAVGDNDPRVPTQDENDALAGTGTPSSSNKYVTADYTGFLAPSGSMIPYAGYTAPSGWLLCDGTAVSRSTYANLFAVLAPTGTFTVTIASPAVFTKTAHGFLAGDKLHFTTTGGLPSGLATNTDYYVISTGLATDTFRVSLTPEGVAVNTSGSQSGVHTLFRSNFGKGDGSTTFNLPDLRQKIPIAIGQFTRTYTFEGDASIVSTGSDTIAVTADCGLYQVQPVVLTGAAVPTGLSTATTYYVIRASNVATTIKLASSQANANDGTAIDITATGSGINTLTYTAPSTQTIIGRSGGEETHGIATTEMSSHTHSGDLGAAGANANSLATNLGNSSSPGVVVWNATGGDTQHNIMSPFINVTYIIKT